MREGLLREDRIGREIEGQRDSNRQRAEGPKDRVIERL